MANSKVKITEVNFKLMDDATVCTITSEDTDGGYLTGKFRKVFGVETNCIDILLALRDDFVAYVTWEKIK